MLLGSACVLTDMSRCLSPTPSVHKHTHVCMHMGIYKSAYTLIKLSLTHTPRGLLERLLVKRTEGSFGTGGSCYLDVHVCVHTREPPVSVCSCITETARVMPFFSVRSGPEGDRDCDPWKAGDQIFKV